MFAKVLKWGKSLAVRLSRNRLLAGITQENLHGEQDFGRRVGKEEW